MSTLSSEVAAWAKLRLGHVAPGTDENHRVQTANSFARVPNTGIFPSSMHRIIFLLLSQTSAGGISRLLLTRTYAMTTTRHAAAAVTTAHGRKPAHTVWDSRHVPSTINAPTPAVIVLPRRSRMTLILSTLDT